MAGSMDHRAILARSPTAAAGVMAAGAECDLLMCHGIAGAEITIGPGQSGISTAETHNPVAFTLGGIRSPGTQRAHIRARPKFESVGFKMTKTTFEEANLIDDALSGKLEAVSWREFSAVNRDIDYTFSSPTTISGT